MSLSIILFQGCKLTNKYHEVYRNTTDLATYLGTVPHKEVYSGDDIYYTNSGTISIESNLLVGHNGDKYNYIQFTHSTGGGTLTKRFAFINNITIVNDVAVIDYSEDIWHTYGITSSSYNFNIRNSLLYQSKTLTGANPTEQAFYNNLPKRLPIALEGQHAPKFRHDDVNPDEESECYVLITASIFKLNAQDEVNQRYIYNFLLSKEELTTGGRVPLHNTKTYKWYFNDQLTSTLSWLYSSASDASITWDRYSQANYRYEIMDIKLIPETIGDAWFTSILSADTEHSNGLLTDFVRQGTFYDFDNSLIYPSIKYYYDTKFRFECINLPEEFCTVDEDPDTTMLFYTWLYNGFNNTDIISYSKTIKSDYKYIGIGNMSRFIPIEFNGQTKKIEYRLTLNQFGNSIELFFDNRIQDISQDFTMILPVSVQSASATQQQKVALHTQNLVGILSLAQGATNTMTSMGNQVIGGIGNMEKAQSVFGSNMAGASAGIGLFGTALSGMYGAISSGIQLGAKNQEMYSATSVSYNYSTAIWNCILGGLREIEMEYTNSALLEQVLNKYGYLYAYITSSLDFVYTQYNYVKFTQADVYGNFSQDIAEKIEQILENGIILD